MTAQARRKETRRATYQDVLDAPPHMVAEVIAEPSTPIPDRQPGMLGRVRVSEVVWMGRSIPGLAVLAAGGSFSSPDFT